MDETQIQYQPNGKDISPGQQIISAPLREIISRKPGFVEIWALPIYLGIILLIVAGTYFVKYPDTVEADATVFPFSPVEAIILKKSGVLCKVLVPDNDSVSNGQVIAFLSSTVDPDQAIALTHFLSRGLDSLIYRSVETLKYLSQNTFTHLGVLDPPFRSFAAEMTKYSGELAALQHNGDSRHPISAINANLSSGKKLMQLFVALKLATDNWLNDCCIKAKSAGKLEYALALYSGLHLKETDTVGRVVPKGNSFGATAVLKQSDFSKIQIGQQVQLRLEAFPYKDFGFIAGKVQFIAKKFSDGGFEINIELKSGLVTNAHRILPYIPNMKAAAIVVTKEQRLIHRFYNSFFRKQQ